MESGSFNLFWTWSIGVTQTSDCNSLKQVLWKQRFMSFLTEQWNLLRHEGHLAKPSDRSSVTSVVQIHILLSPLRLFGHRTNQWRLKCGLTRHLVSQLLPLTVGRLRSSKLRPLQSGGQPEISWRHWWHCSCLFCLCMCSLHTMQSKSRVKSKDSKQFCFFLLHFFLLLLLLLEQCLEIPFLVNYWMSHFLFFSSLVMECSF